MLKEMKVVWEKFSQGKDSEVTKKELEELHKALKSKKLETDTEKEFLRILDEVGVENEKVISALVIAFNYA